MSTQKSTKKLDNKILITTRMSPELHSRIEQHRDAMSMSSGGAHITFTVALANLVHGGLEFKNGAAK